MDCKKARQLVPFAADGALDERLIARLHEHLSECNSCAALFDSTCSDISYLENALKSASQQITIPDDFTAIVAARASSEILGTRSWPDLVRHRVMAVYTLLTANRKVVAAAACIMLITAVLMIGVTAGRVLDSSPVATTRVYSGHLVVFTVQPRPNGNMVAGADALNYCKVARRAEESIR